MAEFTKAIEGVLKHEGGLNENENDPGGITNFGISLRFLKSIDPNANSDDIHSMTREKAIEIYKSHFWDNQNYTGIENQIIANYIFDISVNVGAANAHKIVQRAVWACLRNRVLVEDGVLGDKTLTAINFLGVYLLNAIIAERASYYRLLVATNNKLECFLEGWLNRTYQI